jgi:hypothetical protein
MKYDEKEYDKSLNPKWDKEKKKWYGYEDQKYLISKFNIIDETKI